MKSTLLSLTLLLGFNSFSGGFRWPNTEYKYAQVYLYNLDLEKQSQFDWHIYKDGMYAKTKLGTGFKASDKFLEEFHSTLARGVNELRLGLSKCYLPRHGIIYYSELGEPVASVSICFECDKISFWSTNELPKADYEYPHNNWDKAQKQIDNIEKIFKKYEFPVYDSEEAYFEHYTNFKDYESLGEMFIENPQIGTVYYKKYSIEDVRSWNKEIYQAAELKQTSETKITAGGDEWTYQQLSDHYTDTRFIFSFDEEDPYLVEATISHGSILLPFGVSVGMSVEDVQSTFGVYDGIAWPEHIQVDGGKLQIDYYFEKRTLVKIKLTFDLF